MSWWLFSSVQTAAHTLCLRPNAKSVLIIDNMEVILCEYQDSCTLGCLLQRIAMLRKSMESFIARYQCSFTVILCDAGIIHVLFFPCDFSSFIMFAGNLFPHQKIFLFRTFISLKLVSALRRLIHAAQLGFTLVSSSRQLYTVIIYSASPVEKKTQSTLKTIHEWWTSCKSILASSATPKHTQKGVSDDQWWLMVSGSWIFSN